MKKRVTEAQIIGFLREAEAGLPVKDLCRRHKTGRPPVHGGPAPVEAPSTQEGPREPTASHWCAPSVAIRSGPRTSSLIARRMGGS